MNKILIKNFSKNIRQANLSRNKTIVLKNKDANITNSTNDIEQLKKEIKDLTNKIYSQKDNQAKEQTIILGSTIKNEATASNLAEFAKRQQLKDQLYKLKEYKSLKNFTIDENFLSSSSLKDVYSYDYNFHNVYYDNEYYRDKISGRPPRADRERKEVVDAEIAYMESEIFEKVDEEIERQVDKLDFINTINPNPKHKVFESDAAIKYNLATELERMYRLLETADNFARIVNETGVEMIEQGDSQERVDNLPKFGFNLQSGTKYDKALINRINVKV